MILKTWARNFLVRALLAFALVVSQSGCWNPLAGETDLQTFLQTSKRVLAISKSAKSVAESLNQEKLLDDRQTLTFARLLLQFQTRHEALYDFVTDPARRKGYTLSMSGDEVAELEAKTLALQTFLPTGADLSSPGFERLKVILVPLQELTGQMGRLFSKLKPAQKDYGGPVTLTLSAKHWKQIEAVRKDLGEVTSEVQAWAN